MKYISDIFFLFTFFPYLSLFNLPTDVQPYCLATSILIVSLYLIKHKFKLPQFSIPLLLLLFISTVLFLISPFNFTSLRSLSNYYSIVFVSFATYIILSYRKGLPSSVLKRVIIIWFAVGLIQVSIDREFLNFLLSRASTSSTRGTLGLAPEPTFYGITCFLLIIIANFHLKQRRYIFLLVIQIMFFAKSSMMVLFLIIYVTVYFFSVIISLKISIRNIVSILGLIILGVLLINAVLFFFSGSRVSNLLLITYHDPFSILRDLSISDRLAHIYFPVRKFFENFFIPHGYDYDTWKSYLRHTWTDDSIFSHVSIGNRIMSGYGAALFELGIFTIILPYIFYKLIFSYFDNYRDRIFTLY